MIEGEDHPVDEYQSVIEKALWEISAAVGNHLEYYKMSRLRRLEVALEWAKKLRAKAETLEADVAELLRRAKTEELDTPENHREMISPTFDGTSGLDFTAGQREAAMAIY